jgi:hypothetical protein
MTRTPVIFHLQVNQAPQTGLPPGSLVGLVLADMQGVVLDEIRKAQDVATLSKGAVDVSSLVSDLQGQASALAVQRQAFLPLINGQVSEVELSAPGGKPLVFSRASLALMDQVIAAPFGPGAGKVTVASLTGAGSAARPYAQGSSDYTSAINQFFSNMIHVPTAAELQQAEKVQSQWLSIAKLLSVELSVGGFLVGGPAGFEAGTDIGKGITAGVWIATTLNPLPGTSDGQRGVAERRSQRQCQSEGRRRKPQVPLRRGLRHLDREGRRRSGQEGRGRRRGDPTRFGDRVPL